MNKLDFMSNLASSDGIIKIDSSNIEREETEGSEDKMWITYNGELYLMKDSSFNKRRKQNSYAPYCEYIASHFIQNIGYNVHETLLAMYDNRVVVLCKNIFTDESIFEPFKGLHQSSAGTDLADKEYTYDDVIYILNRITNGDNKSLLNSFWNMFLIDAIIGNRDRHEGNWGFIRKDNRVRFTTLFDNGSLLFPDVNLKEWINDDFIKKRVFTMPGSQFKMWKEGITDRAMRTNFYEVINQCKQVGDKVFTNCYDSMAQKKDIIVKAINSINHSLIPKDFLFFAKVILYCRFNCLILDNVFDEVIDEAYDLFKE